MAGTSDLWCLGGHAISNSRPGVGLWVEDFELLFDWVGLRFGGCGLGFFGLASFAFAGFAFCFLGGFGGGGGGFAFGADAVEAEAGGFVGGVLGDELASEGFGEDRLVELVNCWICCLHCLPDNIN